MTFERVDPVVRTSIHSPEDEIITHPAYGLIDAHRVHGKEVLFGSDVSHQGYIAISLHEAELHKSHAHESVMPRNIISRVILTEAQWVSFVSRMNMGTGTECTLQIVREGKCTQVPGISYEATGKAKLDAQQANILAAVRKRVDEAHADAKKAIQDMPKKKQAEMMKVLERLTMHAESNLEFYKEVLTETNEKLVTSAKIEIESAANAVVTKLGLQSLGQLSTLLTQDPQPNVPHLENNPSTVD